MKSRSFVIYFVSFVGIFTVILCKMTVMENLKMLLPLIYIIPTYILYAIILYIIFVGKTKSKFSGSFYKLFGISAAAYTFASIIYFFAIRMPSTPFLTPFVKLWGLRGFTVTFFQTALWYITNLTPLFHLIVSFNRFTVFILKTRYERFWQDWLFVFVGFCFLFPIAFVWHIPFCGIYMLLRNESDENSLRYLAASNRAAVPWMNNPRNAAIVITCCSILSFIFNFYCITKLLIEKFCWANSSGQKRTSKQDVLLTVYTILVFACDVLHCLHQYTILTINDEDTIIMMFEIQYYLFDMSDLAPAWFIIITNTNLRNQIISTVFLRKTVVQIISTHSTNVTVLRSTKHR